MTEQQPEALRLANELDSWVGGFSGKAADLLRSQHAEIERLRDELETERIRLAVCGVVALSDTPESAAKAREMKDQYRSASLSDVACRVDECMALRAETERLRAELEALRNQEPTYWGPRCAINGGYTTFVAGMFKVNPTDVPLYFAAGAQPAPSVPDCPYPCGWKNLLTIALQDGAFLARAVEEGEVVTESIRATTMKVVLNLREVLLAINNAPEAPEAPETHEATKPTPIAFDAAQDLLAACKEFVRKVEAGEARSVRSYAQMKAAIAKAENAQPAPSVPGRATMIERLKAAVEGECDGLAVDDRHAEAILDYVLAAAPEASKRKPLTDEQIDAIMPNPSDFGMYQPPWSGSDITILRAMARAVEAAHGIKENSNDRSR